MAYAMCKRKSYKNKRKIGAVLCHVQNCFDNDSMWKGTVYWYEPSKLTASRNLSLHVKPLYMGWYPVIEALFRTFDDTYPFRYRITCTYLWCIKDTQISIVYCASWDKMDFSYMGIQIWIIKRIVDFHKPFMMIEYSNGIIDLHKSRKCTIQLWIHCAYNDP